MSWLVGLWRGVTHAPWLNGLVRGILEAGLMAAFLTLASWLSSSDVPAALVPYLAPLQAGIRVAEGLADQIDPAKRRAPDAP